MNDFLTVLQKLKTYIATNKQGKVLDKDVAELLHITQTQLATIKRRNSTPYKHILEFCNREGICSNELFFD